MSKYDIFKNKLYVIGEIVDGSPYYPSSYNTKITQQDWEKIKDAHAAFLADAEATNASFETQLDEAQASQAAETQALELATAEKAQKETDKSDKEVAKAEAITNADKAEQAKRVAGESIAAKKDEVLSIESQLESPELTDQERQTLQTQLATVNSDIASHEAALAESHAEMTEYKAIADQLTKDIEDLSARIAELTDIISEKEAIIAEKTEIIEKVESEKEALNSRIDNAGEQYDILSSKINNSELEVVAPADQPVVRIINLSQMQEVKRKLEQLKKDKVDAEASRTELKTAIEAATAAGDPTDELSRELDRVTALIEELGDAVPFIEDQIKGMEDTSSIEVRTIDAEGYAYSVDTDGDGSPDFADDDIDGDTVLNVDDAFPYNPDESVDTDGDGIGNEADTDDDGDGVSDANEITLGSDPLDEGDTGELTTLMKLGQQVGAYLTDDFKDIKGESDEHFTDLNAELVSTAESKLAEIKESIKTLKTTQAEEISELGVNNVVDMFKVFDGVYQEGEGDETLPAAIRNLGLKEDQQQQLMDLIVTLSDTQKTDHDEFATKLGDWLDLVGTLTSDELASSEYASLYADKLEELVSKAVEESKKAKEGSKAHAENTIKTMQKATDMRGMETAEGVAWYSDMEDGSSYVLTNDAYVAGKMALKAEVDAGNISLDQWAIESSKLLLRHVGKNNSDKNVANDNERRLGIYQSINFYELETRAEKVRSASQKLVDLQKRTNSAKEDSSTDRESYVKALAKMTQSADAIIAQFEADKAAYNQSKAEATAALDAREQEKAAAYDAYKAETVEEQIAIKFQLYLDAHAKAMEARIQLSGIQYRFAAVSLIFNRESVRLQKAMPVLQDAIGSLANTIVVLDTMLSTIAAELQSTTDDIDPINGQVGLILDALSKMDEDWTTGNGYRANDEWSAGDKEYNAVYSFARNETGELIDPSHIEKVIKAYTAHNAV